MTALRLLYVRPPTVFISYRREDTRAEAGRLYDALRSRWGARYVRRDINDIPPGAEFSQAALDQIARSDVLVVLIGPRWLPERLASPADLVRQEIETALKKKVGVIPVLVGGASLPARDALPPSLLPLLERNSFELSDHRWNYDVQVLASAMERRSWQKLLAIVVLAILALVVGVNALRGPVPTVGPADDRLDSLPTGTVRRDVKSALPGERTVVADSSSPDSLLDSVPPPKPRPAPPPPPPPPPPPSTATVEPRSHPPAAPATGSVVAGVRFHLGPERYREYTLTITDARSCRLRGRVETLEGGRRDIDVLVLTPEDFERFPHTRSSKIFAARHATEVVLDVPLPGPGQYYLVISNYFSGFTGKLVSVENVRWECTERGADTSP